MKCVPSESQNFEIYKAETAGRLPIASLAYTTANPSLTPSRRPYSAPA